MSVALTVTICVAVFIIIIWPNDNDDFHIENQ